MSGASILIVDPDPEACAVLTRELDSHHAVVHVARDAERALNMAHRANPDVLVTELVLPGMSGVEFIGIVRDRLPRVRVVVVTEHCDLHDVIEARNAGAAAVLGKPVIGGTLRGELEVVVEDLAVDEEADASRAPARAPVLPVPDEPLLIGRSPAMVALYQRICDCAETSLPVLIEGETGTGKERVGRAIHELSERRSHRRRVVNLAAGRDTVSESELYGHVKGAFTGADTDKSGILAAAGQGTIVFDEICDASALVQQGLLRVLQERMYRPMGGTEELEFHARVIAITNKSLEQAVVEGRFRDDLRYRLQVCTIVVPPLRDRKSDIPLLAQHFLEKIAREEALPRVPSLTRESWRALSEYDWPGNVRELENRLYSAAVEIRGRRRIRPADLGFGGAGAGAATMSGGNAIAASAAAGSGESDGGVATDAENREPPADPPGEEQAHSEDGERGAIDARRDTSSPRRRQVAGKGSSRYKKVGDDAEERRRLVATLRDVDGNMRQAAIRLGMSRSWLYKLIVTHGIDKAEWAETGDGS